jgi:hypothetical protein
MTAQFPANLVRRTGPREYEGRADWRYPGREAKVAGEPRFKNGNRQSGAAGYD